MSDPALESPLRPRRLAFFAALLILGLVLGIWIDKPVYHVLSKFGERNASPLRDWNKLFWLAGFLPFWFLLALTIFLAARHRRLAELEHHARTLAYSVLAGGAAAWILKILLRRQRPSETDGLYAFRPFAEGAFNDSGLGLPSGHVTVAFSAAFVLRLMFPGSGVIWILFGIGCAFQRLNQGKHFASDVWMGALVGSLCAAIVWHARSKSLARKTREPDSEQQPGTATRPGPTG